MEQRVFVASEENCWGAVLCLQGGIANKFFNKYASSAVDLADDLIGKHLLWVGWQVWKSFAPVKSFIVDLFGCFEVLGLDGFSHETIHVVILLIGAEH